MEFVVLALAGIGNLSEEEFQDQKSEKISYLLHSVVHQDVGATRVNGFRYLFWCVGRDICCGF